MEISFKILYFAMIIVLFLSDGVYSQEKIFFKRFPIFSSFWNFLGNFPENFRFSPRIFEAGDRHSQQIKSRKVAF